MKLLIAIDPGANGGMAFYQEGANLPVWTESMPKTEGDILEILYEHNKYSVTVVLEDLVKFAGTNMPGSAMSVYASNWGFIKGASMALGYRVELVKPQAWQKSLGLGTRSKGQSKTSWKNKLKSEAQRLYPQCRVTLQTADALLILEYGRNKL